MADDHVVVHGLDNLVRTMRKMGEDVSDLKAANAAAAQLVAAAATARAPRRTGKLASTVRGSRELRRARVSAGRATVPYAGPIHWGWPSRRIAAQPFISDAARQTEPVWVVIYQRDVQNAVDKVKGV